tara:strand:+ start:557 stop:937 length:381 start_codon:yes stop_codon:yes gene_type:complete
MPKIARAFARTRNQFNLWMELMTAIDNCPEVVPCTNFPDLFFPESANGHALKDIREAQRMCSSCPIQLKCAIYGLEAEESDGVWGGLSLYDRKKLKKRYGSIRKASEALKIRYRQFTEDGIQADKR